MADPQVFLEQYYSRLIRQERRAFLTAETYRFEIRRFLIWLAEESRTIEAADAEDLFRYLEQRRIRDGIGSRSVSKAVMALRSFFRFAMEEQLRTDNPADLLETPRKPSILPAVIDRKSAALLFDALDTGTPLGIRNRALYELLYAAGLRVSEAAALDVKDLMLSKRLIRVKGKRNKERLVIFGEQAASWLTRYLTEVRPLLAGSGGAGSALFIGRTGKRLSRKGIWKNYAEAAGSAGISSKLHTLRHTFATELLKGGADLRSVQELLGHSDLKSTQVYTHVDVSMLRESHRRYMPALREYT